MRGLKIRVGVALAVGAAAVALAWFSQARVKLVAPPATLLLRDRHGAFLAEVGSDPNGDAGYWPVTTLPPRVVACTLAAEDRHFAWHPGVDPIAVARALWQNGSSGHRISGASTVAMQVARIQSPGRRGYFRKAFEAATAWALTQRFGREDVLRHYLRVVPYGNRVRGIGYAARRYFDKPSEDLSWAESAFLAALPQAPARMNPLTATGKRAAVERGLRILDELHRERALPDAEWQEARAQIDALAMPMPGRRPDSAMHAVLELERQLTAPAARAALGTQTIIDTSIDATLQEEIAWRTWSSVRAWEAQGAGNAAVVVLDAKTAEVLAWVGSTDYFDRAHAGAIDYVQVKRSPGSTLKPFFYALALDRGAMGPATILDDLRNGDGGIVNADPFFLGPLLPRVALANSRNTTAVEVVQKIGLGESYHFLGQLALHEDGNEPAEKFGLGLAIGNEPVTLANLVRAYGALANGGTLRDLTWYRGQPQAPAHRVLSEDSAREIGLFLSDPQARLPTFPRMGATEFPFPVAVKTGTSSNFRDAWTVAWSGRYLVGVWVGHPDWRPMNGLSGYRSAATLARQVITVLHQKDGAGLADLSFPPPRGATSARVCAMTGKLAGPHCDTTWLEWFPRGTEPGTECDAHERRAIDVRNGLLASSRTPKEYVDVRTFLALGARYADWQSHAGFPRAPEDVSLLGAIAAPDGAHRPDPRAALASTGLLPQGRSTRPERLAVRDATLKVSSPRSGAILLRDPETPEGMSTLSLEAVIDPPSSQVVWYVDGAPWRVVDYPYSTRWPLTQGAHTFEARLPGREEKSGIVRIEVQ